MALTRARPELREASALASMASASAARSLGPDVLEACKIIFIGMYCRVEVEMKIRGFMVVDN